MEKISHLICGKPLWKARPTFLTKHRKVGGEYIKKERGEIENERAPLLERCSSSTTILPTRAIMILFLKRSLYASWTQNLLHDPPAACPPPDASRVAAVNDHLCWPCQTWSDYLTAG